MGATLLTPSDLVAANEVMQWAHDYLMRSHPRIQRPSGNNVVCPFVRATVANDSLYLAFHPEVDSGRRARAMLEEIMLSAMEDFQNLGLKRSADRHKKALLVVFPALPESESHVLDRAHAALKTRFVAAGLMIGQFHKDCDERSVHNAHFRVSRSPLPLMAVRDMSRHDILFLHERREWFEHYRDRFGTVFDGAEALTEYERHLRAIFRRAAERFRS